MKNNLLLTTALIAAFSAANAFANQTVINADETLSISEDVSNQTALTGGAFFNNGTLNLGSGLTFEDNSANLAGGTVYNNQTLNVGNNVTFQNNSSFLDGYSYSKASEMGAAIYSEGDAQSDRTGQVTIGNNVTFSNNQAYGGGALYLFGANNASIGSNVMFDGNKALAAKDSNTTGGGGGAIAIVGNGGVIDVENGDISLTIGENATFQNNIATYGGAINNNTPGASISLASGAKFLNNEAKTSVGGAVYNLDKFTASDVTFDSNKAVSGGAFANAGTATFNGAVFTDNTASSKGGAIYNYAGGTINLNGTNTFSGNKANNDLNDIYNAGQLNVNGDLILDGGIINTGTITFANGSSLKTALDGETAIAGSSGTVKGTTSLVIDTGLTGGSVVLEGDIDDFSFASNSLYNITADDSTDGLFNIEKKSTAEVAASTGADNNQAGAIAAITSGDSSSSVFNRIANTINTLLQSANAAEVQTALNAVTALAPEVAPMVQQTQTEMTRQIFGAVGTRLSGGAVASAVEGKSSGDNIFERAAMWVQGLFNKSKLDNTKKVKGFDADTTGLAFGVEKYINDDVKVGIGYAYSQTDIDGFLRDTDVDTHTAILYGEYKPSQWFVNGIASYGWSDYNEDKNVAGNLVKADYDVNTYGLQLMTGYETGLNGYAITPEAGLRYVHIKQDAYKDTASQHVSGGESDILTGVIGAKVAKSWELDNGAAITPEVRFAMTYDIANDDTSSVVTLANGSAYTVEGKALKRFGMEFGAGVTASVNDKIDISLGYEGKFRSDYKDHTGLINARYAF